MIRIKGHTTIITAQNNDGKCPQILLQFIEPNRNAHLKTFGHKKRPHVKRPHCGETFLSLHFHMGQSNEIIFGGNYQSLLGVFINDVCPLIQICVLAGHT